MCLAQKKGLVITSFPSVFYPYALITVDIEKCLNCLVLRDAHHVRLFIAPWTVVYQAPMSMRFFQTRILEWVAIS